MTNWLQTGITAAKQGDKANAVIYLKQALGQDPRNPFIWCWLGDCLEDPRKKIECFERALRYDPANFYAKKELGKLQQTNPTLQPAITSAPVQTATEPQPGSTAVQSSDQSNRSQPSVQARSVNTQTTITPQPQAAQPVFRPRSACPTPVAELMQAIIKGSTKARVKALEIASKYEVYETAEAIVTFLARPAPRRFKGDNSDYVACIELLTEWNQFQYLKEIGYAYRQRNDISLPIGRALILGLIKASEHELAYNYFSAALDFKSLGWLSREDQILFLVYRMVLLQEGAEIKHPGIPDLLYNALCSTLVALSPDRSDSVNITPLKAKGALKWGGQGSPKVSSPLDWFTLPALVTPFANVIPPFVKHGIQVDGDFILVSFAHIFFNALGIAYRNQPAIMEKLYNRRAYQNSIISLSSLTLAMVLAQHGRLPDTTKLVMVTTLSDWQARLLAYEALVYQAAAQHCDHPQAYQALYDPIAAVSGSIAYIMALSGIMSYRPHILEGLNAPEVEKRVAIMRVVYYLALNGDSEALARIRHTAVNDPHGGLRNMAKDALAHISKSIAP